MRGQYRPTVADMTDSSKWQQLSCREAGKFDDVNAKRREREAAKRKQEGTGATVATPEVAEA